MEAGLGCGVELVGRNIVAQVVAAVVGEEQLARDRVPVEPDRVADAAGVDLELVAIRAEPDDRAFEALNLADVAGSADRDVELAVGAKSGIAPAVVALIGENP